MQDLLDGKDYLSKENGDCLKGIFAICVLIHHLYQHSGMFRGSIIGAGLQFLGYLSVGVFFFLSGYGLMKSFLKKGTEYLRTFLQKRLLPFYITVLIMTTIYALFRYSLGDTVDMVDLVQSLLFGGTIISNGWYLQTQLLFYIAFFLVFRFCRSPSGGSVMLTIIGAFYIIVMNVFDYAPTWYVSTPLFVLGLWFAQHKSRFDDQIFNNMKWLPLLLVAGAILFASLMGYKVCKSKHLDDICLVLADCAFVLVTLLAIGRISLNFRITRFLGRISFEIYVVQGICLTLFHSKYIYIHNPYLFIAAVSASTIVLAIALHPIINNIFSLCGGSRGESK